MLVATTDLNNALLSYILTGYDGFSTSAGYVSPGHRFDHDISILIPELWCRMDREEKNPERLIREGLLEKVDDFEYKGQKVLASRLGYRITPAFIFKHLGLHLKQQRDIHYWQEQIVYLEAFKSLPVNQSILQELRIKDKLAYAKKELSNAKPDAYRLSLEGTIGLDPIFKGKK